MSHVGRENHNTLQGYLEGYLSSLPGVFSLFFFMLRTPRWKNNKQQHNLPVALWSSFMWICSSLCDIEISNSHLIPTELLLFLLLLDLFYYTFEDSRFIFIFLFFVFRLIFLRRVSCSIVCGLQLVNFWHIWVTFQPTRWLRLSPQLQVVFVMAAISLINEYFLND